MSKYTAVIILFRQVKYFAAFPLDFTVSPLDSTVSINLHPLHIFQDITGDTVFNS